MTAARGWWAVLVFVAMLIPADLLAQGRGRGRDRDRGRGPDFCRSGQGHPVYGWEWCERRGWGGNRRDPAARNYPDARRYPAPNRDAGGDYRYGTRAFDTGYTDGFEKGLDDGRERRAHDPVRHRWYREGDRGYDSRDGSRAQYQNDYRDGFRRGYEAGYRDGQRSDRGGGWNWPF